MTESIQPAAKPAAAQPAPPPYHTANRPAFGLVLGLSAAAALLYTFCFKGISFAPRLAFTVFCPAAFAALAAAMHRLGYLRDKRALWLAAPVLYLSAMNGLFSDTLYPFTNVLAMHALFAAFALTAGGLGWDALFTLGGLGRLCCVAFGDWTAAWRMAASRLGGSGRAKRLAGAGKYAMGAVIAFPFLIVIGFLLIWADKVFERLALKGMDWLGDRLYGVDITLAVTFAFAFVYFAGYVWCAVRAVEWRVKPFAPAVPEPRAAVVFLALINALFAVFAVIQTAFLFTGGLLELPGDLTYAQYAREGFFQLLAVTVINFGVIYALLTCFKQAEAHRAVKALIFALLGFTLLLVASSGYRMFMYVSVYGFTPLRLSVITFLVMEVVLCAISAKRLTSPQSPFVRRFVTVGLAFYVLANVTGSYWAADRLNSAMYSAGALPGYVTESFWDANGRDYARHRAGALPLGQTGWRDWTLID